MQEKDRDLNIAGLEVDEQEISSYKTNRNSDSKSTQTQYSTEKTHLEYHFQLPKKANKPQIKLLSLFFPVPEVFQKPPVFQSPRPLRSLIHPTRKSKDIIK